MDNLKDFKLHYYDEVNPREVEITNRLTHALTDVNLKRIETQLREGNRSIENKKLKKEDFLYVCITGLPSLIN